MKPTKELRKIARLICAGLDTNAEHERVFDRLTAVEEKLGDNPPEAVARLIESVYDLYRQRYPLRVV